MNNLNYSIFLLIAISFLPSCSGPKHNPLYKISVSILESKPFIGTGKSKQEAEQSGAYKLLQNINIK